MVIVVTNKIEPWFKYIWEQFAQINLLQTEYRLVTSVEPNSPLNNNHQAIIEYGTVQKRSDSLFVPKKNKFKVDNYTWLNDMLSIYCDTYIDQDNYDIFYNAFVHLSRLEEWESTTNEKKNNSYSYKHPRRNNKIWEIPIVNYLFNDLEKKIKSKYPEVSFGQKIEPVIELSHDVDYIEKTIQLRLKQPIFDLYNAGKHFFKGNISKSISKLEHSIKFAISKGDYWCFDYWEQLEKNSNRRSTFYVYSKTDNRNSKSWLLDPSYNISANRKFQQRLIELSKEGFEIGLHGSFESAVDEDRLKKEKEILENVLGSDITKIRQHWLRYDEKITPYIHNRLFKYDSTLGWNDQIGFRSGCASRYNPYDHQNEKHFDFLETPMIIMDSHIFDYGCDDDKLLTKTMRVLATLDNCKKTHVSICWHAGVCSDDYKWNVAYEKVLDAL